jgi:apolipoprotein N-acyltransferase
MLRKIKETFADKNKNSRPSDDISQRQEEDSALTVDIPEGEAHYAKLRASAETVASAPALTVASATGKHPTEHKEKEQKPEQDKKSSGPVLPLVEHVPSLIMRGRKKKPFWLVAVTELFNGAFIAVTLISTAGLLIESYLQPSFPVCAWLAFIPFAFAILHIKNPVFAFIYGLSAGWISYMGIIYWINSTVYSGTGSLATANLAVASLSLVLALQFGFFGLLCSYLKRVKWLFPLAGACAWVMLELAHQLIAYKFTAFPWFVLGYTQFAQQDLIQISAFTGAYGVSFLIVFMGLSFGTAFCNKIPRAARRAYLILPVLASVVAFLAGRNIVKDQRRFLTEAPQKLSVALMQPYTHNLLIQGYDEDVIYTIYDQTQKLEDKRPGLIIWPESSYPGSFQDEGYADFMKEVSSKYGGAQITGSYSTEGGRDFVSAALFDETGLKDIYHKVKIVPFGEYLPLYSVFKSIYEKYGISSFTGTFAEGKNPGKIFEIALNKNSDAHKQIPFGVNICFESLFPSVWRAQAEGGAQFFVNISNDGWFLDTAAPYQHLRANIFRAVETRRPVLRATNTGISAWIDALGKVEFETQVDKQETALLNFSFQPKAAKTFYTSYGDVFAYICAFITLNIIIYSAVFLNATPSDKD